MNGNWSKDCLAQQECLNWTYEGKVIVRKQLISVTSIALAILASLWIGYGNASNLPSAGPLFGEITEIFVSPVGDDANAGTVDAPVKTLERAQVLLRTQIARALPVGGITVWLRGGTYTLASTLELNPLDSGTSASPVIWRAYPGEAVRITGSKFLIPSEFQATTSESPVWSRLDAAARGKVMQLDLQAAGVTDFGTLQLRGYGRIQNAALELSVNGKVQPLGRWPDVDQNVAPYNHGYMNIVSKSSATMFTAPTDRMSRWTTAPDAWVHGYFGVYWADDHIPLQSVSAPQQAITLGSPPSFGIVPGQSWYAYNLLEEVTQPGEWYLDRSTGLLYLWPTAGFASAEVQVSVLNGPLFLLNGASYVTLQGLQLESTRSSLIVVSGGNNNTFQQMVLRNAGTSALSIQGGTNHRLSQSYVLDSGEDGVILVGGDRKTLEPGNHVIENSEIANNARFARTYHPAVVMEGVGHTVRNNLIHDTSHAAILFTGNDHQIELNEIRNVVSATADAGAIYSGRDWGARGNRIANNFIHSLSSIFSVDAVHGIYLDDMISGIEVRGNVIYRVSGNAIQSSGGRDNIITNNVLARNGTAFNTDARAYQWWKEQVTDWVNGALLDGLKVLNYQTEPWRSRYPLAAAIPNDWAVIIQNDGNPWLYPQGTEFTSNIGFRNSTWVHGLEHVVWFKSFADNMEDQDPHFADESALDLTLKSSSPAFSLAGFQAIPFKNIGLRAQVVVPDPPILGPVTGGDASVRVTFSIPVNNGGATINHYRATCTGGFVGLATTSPIIVSGLTNGSSYTCTVAAYNNVGWSAESAISNIVIPKNSQTIGTVGFNPSVLTVGGTTTVSATASSTLPVTFSSTTPTICTVSGSTVSGVATGTCTIAADQAGNDTYAAATQVTQNITVNSVVDPTTGTLATRYRLYSDATKEHLYTTDFNEYSVLPVCCNWLAEGAAHKLFQGQGTVAGVAAVPYYRLYNRFSFQHHWTTDANEYNALGAMGWSKEGVDGFILPSQASGSVPLYRLYLHALGGLHLWTTDANERKVLTNNAGWADEGIAGYVLPLP
jgi:hypothetical protein